MAAETYSFLDIVASIAGPGGAFPLGADAGVAEEGITVEMSEDKDTMVVGADGFVQHNLHAGKSGRFMIRYLKTSPTNALLSQLYYGQSNSSATWGGNVITIQDLARGDSITGRLAAFQRFPTVAYSKEGPMNEWTFNVGQVDHVLGSGTIIL